MKNIYFGCRAMLQPEYILQYVKAAPEKLNMISTVTNRRAFFYFLEKFSPPQNGEFFESQKEEHILPPLKDVLN